MFVEIVLILTAFALLYYKLIQRPEGLPPGDWGLPIIGRLPAGRDEMDEMVAEQRKKYGNTFSIKMGSRIVVFLTDYNSIKSALMKPELSGRPEIFTFASSNYFTGYGLSFSNGYVSQENRRFTLKTLRDFGMGKSKLEHIIQYEITELLQDLSKRSNESEPLDRPLVQVAVLNIIWKMTADKRYNQDDNGIQCFFRLSMEAEDIMDSSILDFFPWTENLPNFIKNRWFHADKLIQLWDTFRNLMDDTIEEHTKSFDKNNIRDFIDTYLLSLEEDKSGAEEDKFKHDLTNLNAMLLNMFLGGSDTSANTLYWLFLYMCKYPKVQKKIQEEIDAVLGRENRPEFKDRERLPYLDATLYELNRIISLLPNSVLHLAVTDTEHDGYQIPKGTFIMPCIKECHMSPEYFENPQEFLPERFLDSKGKVNTKKEGYMPFSVGRRVCVGESLAKMEIFLFASAILQKFEISGGKEEDPDLSPNVTNAFLNLPKPYPVIVKERLN